MQMWERACKLLGSGSSVPLQIRNGLSPSVCGNYSYRYEVYVGLLHRGMGQIQTSQCIEQSLPIPSPRILKIAGDPSKPR